MQTINFGASGRIHATPAVVWDILADYQHAHPKIVPQRAFSNFGVEAGGYGEGTIIHFTFKAAGTTRQNHQRILTPEPGHILIERDIDGSGQTSFTLTPQEDGNSTQVDIVTQVPSRAGLVGVIERALARLIAPTMRKLYAEELANLDQLALTWVVGNSRIVDTLQ